MNESTNPDTAAQTAADDSRRYCWVCYASDEDDVTAPWVKPCLCRGTTKWVHQSCLQRWVDEKQKGNSTVKVNCPQCGFQYIIHFPNMGQLMLFLDRMDAFIYRVCPFVAAGVVVGSCYWVAVTYGAITVMQVLGYQEGMALMESADPLVLLVGLPTIPVFLILGKMVRWEDKVLRLLRASVRKLPFLRYVLPGFRNGDGGPQGATSTTAVISDPINATRVLCGGLSLPTLATLAGRAFFPTCSTTLNQTLLGGLAFLTIKGLFKVYYKQQYHVIQSKRIIKDNPLHDAASSSNTSATSTSSTGTSSSTDRSGHNEGTRDQ
ncbi:E3 ubiquitin-protein ligase MARCHF5 isoform X2 [Hyalella azteca]|uniref:E3 ubiquitin-protein ligase MARCHF5 n=1 Tax=Hyalella azteca TaxID=294128 RepID=A0A8B7PH62_HYAAZ|nr:E3 ubiquitin-protein ligase MARCHF5 isoform X2 [Hyalella azteca]